jgi:hypothetical protein
MSNIESDQATEEFRSSSEVDFYIHQDMVHIADTKVATRFSDFFIRQIHKLNEVGFKFSFSLLFFSLESSINIIFFFIFR